MATRIHSLEKLFSHKEWHQAEREAFEQAAGWRFGFLFGVALVIVGWGWDAYELWRAHSEIFWLKLALVAFVTISLNTIAGGIAGGARRSYARRFLPWIFLVAITGAITPILSFAGVSTLATLLDPALRDIAIYPFTPAMQERLLLMTIFGAIVGLVAAAVQTLTTSWAWDSSSMDNRFTLQSWIPLFLCVPFAIALGAILDGTVNAQTRAPAQLSHRIIQLALSTPPDADFRKMDTLTMLDYVATLSWRDNFTPRYIQHLTDFDRTSLKSGYVDAEFDNGFVWRCQSVRNGDGLIDCVDLRARYLDWMQQFIRTGVISCDKCAVSIAPTAAIWHVQNASNLSEPKNISFEHHIGGVVVMRADVSGGSVECRFVGANPTTIKDCTRR